MNAVDAIDDAGGTGSITIRVTRDQTQPSFEVAGAASKVYPIESIELQDDGVGFTPANFDSFNTCDSDLKLGRGGRGLGRMLWLLAFDHAEVDSVYRDPSSTGDLLRRRFAFRPTDDGIENHVLEKAVLDARPGTVVRLVGMKLLYRENCRHEPRTLARRVVEHMLEVFVNRKPIKVSLWDDQDGETISLNRVFDDEIKLGGKTDQFRVGGKSFVLRHVLVPVGTIDGGNKLNYCANSRVVLGEPLSKTDAKYRCPLPGDDGLTVSYVGYVTGRTLDDAVNQERTGFGIERDRSGLYVGEVTMQEIEAKALAKVSQYLAPYLLKLSVATAARIERYMDLKGRQYRPIVNGRPNQVQGVAADSSDDEVETALHRFRLARQAESDRLLRELTAKVKPDESYSERLRQLMAQYVDESQRDIQVSLVEYVLRRRAVIELLRTYQGTGPTGRATLEEAVHQLVYPMRETSDRVPHEFANLWLIDERLAFHRFLASDVRMDRVRAVNVDTGDRADLVFFFQASLAFEHGGSPFDSLVLVEFKRPGRDDYSEQDNPVVQVLKYVRDITAGGFKDATGSVRAVSDGVRFYAYVIADLTRTLTDVLLGRNFIRSSDQMGYYHYVEPHRLWIEVLSYDKLVSDASKRNQAFFDRLGMPQVC
jgi:hypothetical protein